MTKRFLVPMAVATICGCAALPIDRTALLQSGTRSEKYCYVDSPAEITERVRTYLVQCYKPTITTATIPVGGVFVPAQSSIHWEVEEEKVPAGFQFAVKSRHGYVLGALITGAERTCSSVLQVYAANQFWTDRFETLNKVARKEKADCPY